MTSGAIRSVKSVAIAMILSGGVLVAGCSPEVRTHGALPPKSTVSQIETGKSTRKDVAQLLGTPSTTSLFDNGETWYYIGSRQQQYAVYANEELERQVMVVTFDKAGTVSKFETLGKDQGTEITLVDRKTPSAGHELTIIEQLLGNIGRFSKTGGSGFDGRSNLPR